MYRYIIVDDESLIRSGIKKKIQAIGFEGKLELAGEADNGAEGLELIKRVQPEIIITDMRMPEMDGIDFLKKLQEDFPYLKIIVISGYSDFEYMKEAISAKAVGYLLKPFNRKEIKKVLDDAIAQIEADRAAKLQIASKEIETEKLKFENDIQTLANLILGHSSNDKTFVLRSNKLKLLKQADRYILMSVYSPEVIDHIPDPFDRCLAIPNPRNNQMIFYLFFLTNTESENNEKAQQHASNIIQPVTTAIKKAFVGISSTKKDLMQLHEAYEETMIALNSRRELISPTISYYNGEQNPTGMVEWEYFDELLFFIESGNVERVVEYVNKLFDRFASDPSITLSEIKYTCEYIVLEIRKMLYHYFQVRGNTKTSTSFGQFLDAYYDMASLRRYMTEVLPGIAQLLNEHTDYSSNNIISNIKTYIHKNINKTLTLDKISSLFFINPSYCSHLFKEKTGINFVDYVNNVRIERAKELLKTTDDKVFKIANNLGFENTKYFFRLFKKVTGLTPEEFRNQYR